MVALAKKKTTKNFSKFDAELDETVCDAYNNADLTLTMKLGFRQINPAGGAATGTFNDYNDPTATARNIIKWTPGSWMQWKTHFVRSAQRFWHGEFWLVNNFPVLEFEDKGIKYRHNIYCRFKLIGADANAGSTQHHVIDVVRLARTETFFGSHSTLYDSRDTVPTHKKSDSAGNKIMQRAHVHEIGHLLGMGHSAEGTASCPVSGNTNASACYGTSDFEMSSVMGSGMDLRAVHAFPWRMAIADMTGNGTIRTLSVNRSMATLVNQLPGMSLSGTDFTSNDWQAKMKRHYPRTEAEAKANAAVTMRPRR